MTTTPEPLSDERLAEAHVVAEMFPEYVMGRLAADLLGEIDRLRAENTALRGLHANAVRTVG